MRTINYVMNRLNISEDEARKLLSGLERMRLIEKAENMLSYYELDRLTPTMTINQLINISSTYEDMIESDSGETEQEAIKTVLGKSVDELLENCAN